MSTNICWELTCDGLVSHPGEVKDSHPLNTTETNSRTGLRKELVFTSAKNQFGLLLVIKNKFFIRLKLLVLGIKTFFVYA